MSQDQVASLVRTALKLMAGALAAKGYGDSSLWEQVVAGLTAAFSIVWSAWSSHQKTVLKKAVAGEIPLEHPEVRANREAFKRTKP